MSYPSFISGIYNSVQQLYRLHFDQCEHIPQEVKDKVQSLRENNTSNRGGRKQYWIDSAKRRGFVDTSFGVHFGCDPNDPIPPIELNDEADVELADVEFGMDGKSALVLFYHVNPSVQYEGSVTWLLHLNLACLYLNALQITCTNGSYNLLSFILIN